MFDINKINNIVNMLNKDYKKIEYRKSLLSLESEILAYLKEINFNSKNVKNVQLKEFTSNDILENNLNQIKENPTLGLFEGIEKYKEIMQQFLTIYHIGFLSEFSLKMSGMIEVVIPVLISKPSFSTTPCSDKINFEEQLSTLEKEGIMLKKGKRNQVIIPASNIDAIKLLLEKVEAKHIKIEIRQESELIIDKISFIVNPKSLDSFNEKKESFIFPVSDKLNVDEIENIYKLLKDMAHAAQNAKEESLKDVCGSLLKSYFSNICDILNIETKIQQAQKEKYKKDKEENMKKKELKSEIAKFVSAENLVEIAKALNKNLETFLNSNIDFHISKLSIISYETIKVSIMPIMSYWMDDDILMTEEDYKKLFKTYKNANRADYLLVPLFCDKNIEKIKEIIKDKIPDAIFESFKANRKKEDYTDNYFYYISEIEFTFSDFSKFL